MWNISSIKFIHAVNIFQVLHRCWISIYIYIVLDWMLRNNKRWIHGLLVSDVILKLSQLYTPKSDCETYICHLNSAQDGKMIKLYFFLLRQISHCHTSFGLNIVIIIAWYKNKYSPDNIHSDWTIMICGQSMFMISKLQIA